MITISSSLLPLSVILAPHGLYFFLAEIMSDKEAQAIVDQALESGSIEQKNTVAVVVGIAGSGKTSLISRLFQEKLPDRYTSTGVAEQSLCGLMHHTQRENLGNASH